MKCSYCNTELLVDEVIEREEEFDYVGGHCPQCNTQFSWSRNFKRVLDTETDLIEQ